MKTRDIILQKTFGLLLEKGYGGVSVSDIQQTTGMARGLLYHYFGSQEKLYEETAVHFLNSWFQVNKVELKDKAISDIIVFTVECYQRIGQDLEKYKESSVGLADVRLFFEEAVRHHQAFAELYRKILNEQYAIWKTAVLNSFSRGELQSGLNLEPVARHFLYIQDGVILRTVAGASVSEVVYTLEKSLREFFEMIKR